MNITLRQIKRYRSVCDGSAKQFKSAFPEGFAVTRKNLDKVCGALNNADVAETIFNIADKRLSRRVMDEVILSIPNAAQCTNYDFKSPERPCLVCSMKNRDDWKEAALKLLKLSFPSKKK